ncbi:hypothetical protein ACRAWG_08520 [Methylobacterium sp. P31]
MTDHSSRSRSPAGYDRWLIETSREAIRRARELLEQTKPLVRNPAPQTRPPGKSQTR